MDSFERGARGDQSIINKINEQLTLLVEFLGKIYHVLINSCCRHGQKGETRQESVYNGLQALPTDADRVLIHDGARCLATAELFDRCTAALRTCQGLIAAIPVKDTIKVVDDRGFIQGTPDRSKLWAAQTPQGFEVQLLKQCHQRGRELGWEVTDDAALFEKCQLPVKIVEGEETNLKVTTPVDLTIAEFILHQRLPRPPGKYRVAV